MLTHKQPVQPAGCEASARERQAKLDRDKEVFLRSGGNITNLEITQRSETYDINYCINPNSKWASEETREHKAAIAKRRAQKRRKKSD